MLQTLSISNVVLIDRLSLTFEDGLCVLTGETGTGKSILLDALGLAMGARAEARLVRKGTDKATVVASFECPADHPAHSLLEEANVDSEDQEIILRRTLTQDGRSKAYINDTPVSASLLRSVAGSLIEVQGQFDQRGLMDSTTHRALLDAAGEQSHQTATLAARTRELWNRWQDCERTRHEAEASLEQARKEEDFLRHSVEELDKLAPEEGESEKLAQQRQRMMHSEKMVQALNSCLAALTGGDGYINDEIDNRSAESHLLSAQRHLGDAMTTAGYDLDPAMKSLERSTFEIQEAVSHISRYFSELDADPQALQEIEDRYFLLQDIARKHRVDPDQLPEILKQLQNRLVLIDTGTDALQELDQKAQAARALYEDKARALSAARHATARELDSAINAELPPLKLEKASFVTEIATSNDPYQWNSGGLDQVAFTVSTNPGSAPGPLGKIASGGELGRFLLAFKVVLSGVTPSGALVFDEVDAGIGGATAHAVGERLARLAQKRQILVITHSPQVAAKGSQHLQVAKTSARGESGDETTRTSVTPLSEAERLDEVARMLAGAEITEEARAAARTLLGQ